MRRLFWAVGQAILPALPRHLGPVAVLLALLANESAALPPEPEPAFRGAGSSSAVACHGGARPAEGKVLRDEHTTWIKRDRHADAFAVLQGERSRSIAANLSGGLIPADKDARCLACHSTPPPRVPRGEGPGPPPRGSRLRVVPWPRRPLDRPTHPLRLGRPVAGREGRARDGRDRRPRPAGEALRRLPRRRGRPRRPPGPRRRPRDDRRRPPPAQLRALRLPRDDAPPLAGRHRPRLDRRLPRPGLADRPARLGEGLGRLAGRPRRAVEGRAGGRSRGGVARVLGVRLLLLPPRPPRRPLEASPIGPARLAPLGFLALRDARQAARPRARRPRSRSSGP